MSLSDALNLARNAGVDLVEIAPNAVPPVCRIVDFGKYRYEMAKKDKESKKHQHASIVKEVQLSPRIDPHDLGVKLNHTIEFLNEDMKVAGYKPDMIPTTKGTSRIGTMIFHFDKILISSCCPDILLSEGINSQVRKKAKIMAIHVTSTDSVRN